jgi:hypothetical protein
VSKNFKYYQNRFFLFLFLLIDYGSLLRGRSHNNQRRTNFILSLFFFSLFHSLILTLNFSSSLYFPSFGPLSFSLSLHLLLLNILSTLGTLYDSLLRFYILFPYCCSFSTYFTNSQFSPNVFQFLISKQFICIVVSRLSIFLVRFC